MKIFPDSKDTSAYYNAGAVKTFLNRKKGTKDYYNADNTFKENPDSATKTAVSRKNVANPNETDPENKGPKKTDKKRVLNAINNNDIRKKSIGIPWSNYIAFMGVKNLADKDVADATLNTSSTLMQPLQSPCRCPSKKRICVLSKKSSFLKFKCGKYTENFKQKIRAQKGHSQPEKKIEVKFTKKPHKFFKISPKSSKIYRNSSTSVQSKSSLKIPFEKSPSSKMKVDSKEKIKRPEEKTLNKGSAGKGQVEFEKSLSEPTMKENQQARRRSMFDLEHLSILERASVIVSRNQNKDINHKLCDAFGSTIFKHNANSPLQMQVQSKSVTEQKSGERIRQKLSSHVDSNKQTDKTENEKFMETYKFSSSELRKCKDQESKASLIEDVLSVINYDDSDPPKRMSSKTRMKTITELITKMEIIKDLLPAYQSSSENVSIKDTLKRQLLTNEDALEMASIVDEIIEEFLCANQMDGPESVPNENGTDAIMESEGSDSTNATLLVTWKDLGKHFSLPLESVESQNQIQFRAENTLVDKFLKTPIKGKDKEISSQVQKSIITVDAADSNSIANALWEGKATYQIQNTFECDSLENVSEKTSPSHGEGYAVEQSKKAMKHFFDLENDSTCENLVISQFTKQKSQPTQNKTDNKMENSLSFNTLKTKANHESDAANEMTEDSLEGARHKTMDRPPRKVLKTYKQRFTLQTGAVVSNSSRESSPDGTAVKTKPKKKVHYLTYPVQTSYNDHVGINLECSTKKPLPSKLPILRTRKVIEEFSKANGKLSINGRSPSQLNKGEEDSKSFVTVSGDTSATSIDGRDGATKRRMLKMGKNVKAVSATDNKRPPYVKLRKIYSKSATETLPKPSEKKSKDAITKRRSDQSKIKCTKSRLPVLRESERNCSDSTDESKMSKLQEMDLTELCKKLKESVLQSVNEVKCSKEEEKKDEIIMKDVETISSDCSNVRKRTLEKCKVEVMLQNEESENKNVYIIKALINDKQTSSTGVVEKCLKLETANQTSTTCSKEIGTKIASLTLIAVTQTDTSNETDQKIPTNTNVDCSKQSMLDEKEVEETTQMVPMVPIEDDIREHATDEVNRESVGVAEKNVFTLPSITVYNKEYLGSLRCFNPTGMGHVFDNVEVFNYNVQSDGNYNRSVTFSEVSVNSDLHYLDSDDESEPSKDRKCFKRLSPQKCLKKTCPSLCRLHSSAIVTECACQYDGVDYQNPEMRCACTNWRESSTKIRRSRIPILVRRCRYQMPKIERAECYSVASEANTSLEEKQSQHMWTVDNMDDFDMKFSQTSLYSNECRPQDKHFGNSGLCSNGHRSNDKRRSNSSLCSGKRRSNSSSRSSLLLSNRDMSVCSSVREIQPGNAKDICDQACLAKMSNEKDTSTSTPKTQKSIASQFCSNEKRTFRRLKATYKIRNNGSFDSVISISKEGLRSSKRHRERWGSLMASLSRKKHSKSALENEKCDKHSKKKYWKEFVSSFRNQKSNPRDNRRTRDHCDCDKQISSKTSRGEIPCKKRCPSNKNFSRASSRKNVYYNDDYPNYPLNTSTYCTIFTNECKNPDSIEVLYPAKEINTTETCESETITIAAAKHSKMCVNSQTRSIEMLTKPHHEVLRSKSEEYLDNEDAILDNTFCDFVVKDDDSTNFLNYNKLQQCYHHCTCGQILKIEVIKNSESSL